MREQFIVKRFNSKFRVMIDAANAIISEYQEARLWPATAT